MSPGTETNIAVGVTQVSRLPHPYKSDCTSDFPEEYADYAPMNNEYSEANCRFACRVYHIYEACQCYETFGIQRFANVNASLRMTNVSTACFDVSRSSFIQLFPGHGLPSDGRGLLHVRVSGRDRHEVQPT